VQVLGGWILRAWPDAPFRRTNSVLALFGADALDARGLDERTSVVEEFYRRRGLPVRFQLGAATSPSDLDARLAARGYAVEAPTLLQTADAAHVARATACRAAERGVVVEIADAVGDEWIAAYGSAHGTSARARERVAAYGRLLPRLGPPCVTALARASAGGAIVGCGFAVLERGRVGVFGMGTEPGARRRGVARAVLHGLVSRALASGAGSAYLQVEADNAPALRLYAAAGFTTLYGYHYRTLGLPPGAEEFA